MNPSFIGREKETAVLANALRSNESEMVAVIGRRRVGKTFLVKETYQSEIAFEITGLQETDLERQLDHFSFTLQRYSKSPVPLKKPNSWLEAFQMLVLYLDSLLFYQTEVE